jgi:hypothetical protein
MKPPAKTSRSRVSLDPENLCNYPYADGRQCRMLRHSSHPSLCFFHSREEMQLAELEQIGDQLASVSGEFHTMTEVRRAVANLFRLVARNRIPMRNAQLLAYLSQLLLYSQKSTQHEITRVHGSGAWDHVLRAAFMPRVSTAQAQQPDAAASEATTTEASNDDSPSPSVAQAAS